MEAKEIERSLLTTYRKTIFRPFTKAVSDYKLAQDGDRICVCISGGKDSFLMAKLMQELERHGKFKIKCEYLVMDPGYSEINLQKIEDNAQKLGIDIHIIKSTIFEAVNNSGHKSPCYICAKMRRGFLYNAAQNLGCNKIALGHHFDDVIETTMLSIIYNGMFNTMLPKVKSENFEGMQMIRPLYLIREKDILTCINKWEIDFNICACPLKKEDSKRLEVKQIIRELINHHDLADLNIFKATENVELDHVRGYIKDKNHVYLYDNFDND